MRKPLLLVAVASLVGSVGCSRNETTNRMAGLPPSYDDTPAQATAPASHEEAPAPMKVPAKPIVALERVGTAREGSSVVVAKLEGKRVAFIADEDENAVRAIDLDTDKELAITKLPGRPAQLLVSKEGHLLVALRDTSAIAIYGATETASPLEPLASIDTATEPVALALTDDDATLLVVSGWAHALESFDLKARTRTSRTTLAREPRAVVASKDGSKAFVAHVGAGHVSAVDLRVALSDVNMDAKADSKPEAVAVKAIDMGLPSWTERRFGGRPHMREPDVLMLDFMIPVPAGQAAITPNTGFKCPPPMRTTTHPARVARQGFALVKLETKEGERIFFPHETIATGNAHVVSNGYGGGGEGSEDSIAEMFDLGVIDADKSARATSLAGNLPVTQRVGEAACKLPRAAVSDAKSKSVFVSCSGNDRVIAYGEGHSTRTWKLGAGVTGLALDDDHALVAWSQFEHALYAFSTNETKKGEAAPAPRKIALPRAAEGAQFSALALEGRSLFHASNNPNVSFDGRACATCHPDGRDDGLVWSTPEGPRQTIFLAGRVKREAPFGWRGQHTSVREHMKDTIKNLKGKGLTDHEQDALDAYLTELKGPSLRPAPERAELSALEARGRTLFRGSDTGCATCHAEKDGFSDREAHDVQSASTGDRHKAFLAPSLRFVGESGPWFHDGRYASLAELLEKSDGKMGSTAHLSKPDIQALEAYLRTL